MHMANLDIAQDNFTSIHHTYTTAIGVVAVTLAWQVTVGREAATITTTSHIPSCPTSQEFTQSLFQDSMHGAC